MCCSRYRSKYEKEIKEKARNPEEHMHKTFGYAEAPLPTPDNFLKRDEGIRFIRPRTCDPRCCTSRRPPVPKHNELNRTTTELNLNNEKNFKLVNIMRAKSAVARNTGPKCFEQTPPSYILAPKYGKVPKYLKKMSEKQMQMELMAKQAVDNSNVQNDCRRIPHEEKQQLLNGLKHNWDLLQKEYQRMPLLIDTIPKMLRKTKLENNLKQLEKDICLLNSNHNSIYIVSN